MTDDIFNDLGLSEEAQDEIKKLAEDLASLNAISQAEALERIESALPEKAKNQLVPHDPQKQVWANVEARGYIDPWDERTLGARQVAKLAEELAELAKAVHYLNGAKPMWIVALERAGKMAKAFFDRPEAWNNMTIDWQVAGQELPDIFVPALLLAEVMGIDGPRSAVEKSQEDVDRGIRPPEKS